MSDERGTSFRAKPTRPCHPNTLSPFRPFRRTIQHVPLVERVGPPAPDASYPVCLAGKRACPPEDSGGIWGYDDLLAALADPNDPEHDDMLDWLGGTLDPEAFDLEAVNRRLARMR